MERRSVLVALTVLALGWIGPPAWAASGDLDPSFGEGGTVIAPAIASVRGAATSPDGRSILVGQVFPGTFGQAHFSLVSADGDPVTVHDQVQPRAGSGFTAARPDASGRWVLTGWAGPTDTTGALATRFLTVRLLPGGELDRSFHGDGIRMTRMGELTSDATDVAIGTDGRMTVVGHAVIGSTGVIAIARYLPDGSLDRSFSSDGRAYVRFAAGAPAMPRVAIGPRGGTIVAGLLTLYPTTSSAIAVTRLRPDGTVDKTFSDDGRRVVRFGAASLLGLDVVVPSTAKIVMGTSVSRVDGYAFALVRLLPNGTLDASFGHHGRSVTRFGAGSDQLEGLALGSEGTIVAVGSASSEWSGTPSTFAIARYSAAGTPITGWGHAGRVTTTIGSTSGAVNGDLLFDGRLVVSGWTEADGNVRGAIARYLVA